MAKVATRTKPMMGMMMANSATKADPANSAVAIRGFPSPPVKIDDFALSAVVVPCIMPAIPPPAMIATIHFTDGGKSVITDAVAIVPATIETGEAMASMIWSSQGTQYAMISRMVAEAKAIVA